MVIKIVSFIWAITNAPCTTNDMVCQYESKGITVYTVRDDNMYRVIVEDGYHNWVDYRCPRSENEFCGVKLKWIKCATGLCLNFQGEKSNTNLTLAGNVSGSAENIFDLSNGRSDIDVLYQISRSIVLEKNNIKFKQCDGAIHVFKVGSKLGACGGAYWFNMKNLP